MVLALIAVCLTSLGPILHIAGNPYGIVLPWALCLHLPLIDQALPARLSVYSFLIADIIAAFYLSDRRHPWSVRGGLGVLVVIFLLPNVQPFRTAWRSSVDTPAFWRDGIYRRYLKKDDVVLMLPFNAIRQMLWQAQTGMYFSMAGGYLGPDPVEYTAWPVVRDLRMERVGIDFSEQLKAFLGAHRVKAIVLDGRAREPWLRALSVLNVTPVEVGDVLFYRVPSDVLVTYKDASPTAFGTKYARLLFAAGVSGAERYVVAGLPLSKLTPWEAERQRVLDVPTPRRQFLSDPRWQGDLWLGTFDANHIGVGGVHPNFPPFIGRGRGCFRPPGAVAFPVL